MFDPIVVRQFGRGAQIVAYLLRTWRVWSDGGVSGPCALRYFEAQSIMSSPVAEQHAMVEATHHDRSHASHDVMKNARLS